MSARKILRRRIALEEIEIPSGHVVCFVCGGKGCQSKYDEGWTSPVHSPELAAERQCMFCRGNGYVPEAAA